MVTEDKGGTAGQDPKAGAPKAGEPDPKSAQQPGGEDYAGMQRALNEIRDGKKMPPYLVERGITSRGDLEAALEKASAVKPDAKPAATGGDGPPPMPLPSQYRDDSGDLDEPAYQAATAQWASDFAERTAANAASRASGVVTERDRVIEQEALDAAAKELPEALQADGLGRLLLEGLAVSQSGADPATPRIIAEQAARLKAVLKSLTEAEVQALAEKAKGNLGGEPPNMGPGGPAPGSAKEDEMPGPNASTDEKVAWVKKLLAAGRAEG